MLLKKSFVVGMVAWLNCLISDYTYAEDYSEHNVIYSSSDSKTYINNFWLPRRIWTPQTHTLCARWPNFESKNLSAAHVN